MIRFEAFKWNKSDKLYPMLILNEEDIDKEDSNIYRGCGYDIIIIPKKYEEITNEFLTMLRFITIKRNGEIIYI